MSDSETFNILSETSSPTAIVQTILHSSTKDVPTVSVVSTHVIKEAVKNVYYLKPDYLTLK
tara:strand:- start:359 stop:541 length:183 start_codon:yes stop_codon:yes gene_type:complete